MGLTIKVHNRLLDLSSPKVMAIVNVSPDSFYTSCGDVCAEELCDRVGLLLQEGADIIDIGGCSTRPGSTPIDADEEWGRLSGALRAIRVRFPEAVLSVDTFRAEVAEKAIQAGADIINDVYGGEADCNMWKVVASYQTPYVLTLAQGLHKGSENGYDYTMSDVVEFFQNKLDALHRMGVADVIIDPGFGFGKDMDQNYAILRQLGLLSVLDAPILAGISRKSMLYKPLGLTPSDVLPATIAANTLALERGAHILRVHDVAAAKQAITIYSLTHT